MWVSGAVRPSEQMGDGCVGRWGRDSTLPGVGMLMGRETGLLGWGAGGGLEAEKPGFWCLARYLVDLLLGVLGKRLKANAIANVGGSLKGSFGLVSLPKG